MQLLNDTDPVKFAFAEASGPQRPGEGNEPSLLISVEQAATILGIGRTGTFELVMNHAITSVKIGRRRLVVRSSLEEFVQRLIASQSPEEDN
jgi:excisionase family DNA binding protein